MSPPAGAFTQISAGLGHACGIKSDGAVACWGNNDYGQASSVSPAGAFIQVSAGAYHTCGVKSDGSVECWGSNTDVEDKWYGQATPPPEASVPGAFAQVATGWLHTCGLKSDGTIACWGAGATNTGVDYHFGQAMPPAGVFTQVTAGLAHTCGLKSDGSVTCWGDNGYGEATPPAGVVFTQISAGWEHTCGIKNDGAVACWGAGTAPDQFDPPQSRQSLPVPGVFTQVSGGGYHTCGIRNNGAVACWGNDVSGSATPPLELNPAIPKGVAGGRSHTCAIKRDGTVACWGRNDYGQAPSVSPTGTFTQISAGDNHNCAIRSTGALECWGAGTTATGTVYDCGQSMEPAGTFKQVSAGMLHTCGVRTDGSVACWGDNSDGQTTPPAEGSTPGAFRQVSAGSYHTCGIKSNGAVVCWGSNGSGQAAAPPGTFTQVTAGQKHTCGIKSDGSVACWGWNITGQATPPPGVFAQIDAGQVHNCGVKNDRSVVCWGDNSYGRAPATRTGSFTQVSAGWSHTCGLRSDGALECWGDNTYGQATAPGLAGPITDLDPPLVQILVTPPAPDGANDWYRNPVTLEAQANDTASEVLEVRCTLDPATAPASYWDLPDGPCPFLGGAQVGADGMHTLYAAAMDVYDNWSVPVSIDFRIDATPPVFDACPAGGPFLLHSGEHAIGPAGVDAAISGLDEAASTLSGIVTTKSVGPKTLTFIAADLAGSSASLDCTYGVIYDFSGFYPPVEPPPALNAVKAGQAIPLKFSLEGNQGLEIIAAGHPTSGPVDCDAQEPLGELAATETAGKSALSYHAGSGRYSYVWKTDKTWAGACRTLVIRLTDGTEHLAAFRFK